MIQKFTQFKGSKNKDSNSPIFKPFNIFEASESPDSKKEIKKEIKKENKKVEDKPELRESFIPINIPPFDKIIKDLQDKVAPVNDEDTIEIPDNPEDQETSEQIIEDPETDHQPEVS